MVCILRITDFFDYAQLPVFLKLENTTFNKLDLLPSSDEGRKQKLRLILSPSKGPNRVGVSSIT
jgi:hypothetical protein